MLEPTAGKILIRDREIQPGEYSVRMAHDLSVETVYRTSCYPRSRRSGAMSSSAGRSPIGRAMRHSALDDSTALRIGAVDAELDKII
jgi:hypothetical protein